MSEPDEPWAQRDAAALVHELEVHQAALELQNVELQATNAELRRSNASLVVARDRFRALYELAPVAYVTVDPGRTITDLNRAAEILLDAPRTNLIGATLDLFVADAARADLRTFVANVFAAGRGRHELVVRRVVAAPVDALIEGVALPVGPPGGPSEPARCVLAIVDITARKLAETARRHAQDEVLTIVSHDLRGPLNAIGLACDALVAEPEAAIRRECVAVITRASARCERLIQDLLGIAQIEHGRLTLALAPFDLRALVGQVCRDYRPAVAAARSTLTVDVAAPPLVWVGDRDRMHQVLSNLLGNALTHARGAAITVALAVRPDAIVLSVADDGPGIPPAELVHVFERYRQGTRHHGGAGLGLAIVKGLVEAHHGTVTVASPPGEGAHFEVVLPRGAAPGVAR